MTTQPAKLAAYSLLDEPFLTFGGSSSVHQHPLRGLLEYGPYTQVAFPRYTPEIRVAIAGPAAARKDRRELFQSLRQRLRATDRREYLPEYPGFETVFRVPLVPAASAAQLELPSNLEEVDSDAQAPQVRVQQALTNLVRRLISARELYDIVVVHLPDTWEPGLRSDTFDAHHELKALCATEGIPTQIIRDQTFRFRYHASRAWRLAIALYAKAGGTPWKLAPIKGTPADTAYIGLAYAYRGDPAEAQFVTCCSQVFDSDGGGMQFFAYDARDPIDNDPLARDNPYLGRDDMRAVMARSLNLYQARNGGRSPSRMVINKTTPFQEEEVAGALDALSSIPDVECVQIVGNVNWRAVWLKGPKRYDTRKSNPDPYPVHRGTMVPLSGTKTLLWLAGNAPQASTVGHYYQGGKSIPTPLLLQRHVGHGPLELPATETLALSKMDWNNDALYNHTPVTIGYAQRLAQVIAKVPTLRRGEYPYRLFM